VKWSKLNLEYKEKKELIKFDDWLMNIRQIIFPLYFMNLCKTLGLSTEDANQYENQEGVRL
jgi:hypothetical protein